MNVYTFIAPIVMVLLIAEIIYSVKTKNGLYNFQDTVTNLATGIGNQCVNLAVAFFVYKWYGWLYQFCSLANTRHLVQPTDSPPSAGFYLLLVSTA